ncbi:MAG: GNAT family N-acetyltransferase [Microbacterium sp.]
MNTTPAGVDIRPLTIPASIDAPDADDFTEMVRVRNLVYRELNGTDDEAMTAAALLPHYQPDPDELRLMRIVVVDGEVVGRVGVDIPLEAGSKSAFWLIELLREHHGRGIGSTAYRLVEQTAREHGRTVLQSWAQHPDAPGARLASPTGFGSIPDDHAARFYRRHGYALEQVERQSALDLTTADSTAERLLAQARNAAVGYRVLQWRLPTPAEHADGYAWVKSRMSTDAPAANLEFDEQEWDAERIARHEQRYLAGGHTVLVTAAQHVDSGELVAFNELVIGEDLTGPTHQEDTLVLKEHRGHRLGMLVKCAGLKTWRAEIAPHSPKVITYNAEENRPMLDINEAIGFVPVAYEGAWKKVLT